MVICLFLSIFIIEIQFVLYFWTILPAIFGVLHLKHLVERDDLNVVSDGGRKQGRNM